MVPNAVRQRQKLSIGDVIEPWFDVDDQDRVEVPPEFEAAREDYDDTREIWLGLTPCKRLGFAYRIASAKMLDTCLRRVDEILGDHILDATGQGGR